MYQELDKEKESGRWDKLREKNKGLSAVQCTHKKHGQQGLLGPM